MGYIASVYVPSLGLRFDKEQIDKIRVTGLETNKVPVMVYQSDGKTPEIDPATNQPKFKYIWVGRYKVMAFLKNGKQLLQREMDLPYYDPDKPAEKQYYAASKRMVFVDRQTGEKIPYFTDIEDEEDAASVGVESKLDNTPVGIPQTPGTENWETDSIDPETHQEETAVETTEE
ncbi:MAG: hypothetical protein LBN27_05080 [Prevotellaceae bacterium]|jgi:hypothetical protein|nr:hypothetical protein [Prevotellaceae bacterium]